MVEKPKRIQRREVIKATGGLAGVGLLAGCSSDGGDGGNGGDGSDGDDGSDGSDGSGGTSFPEDDIRLIIPFSTGGGFDTYSRLAAPYVAEHLPSDIKVNPQNVTGGGGIIGHEDLFNADPDGYTHGITFVQGAVRDQIVEDVDYDMREFNYFAQVQAGITGLGVGPHTDIQNFDDYVEAVQNGEVTFGTTGLGSDATIVPATIGAISGLYDAERVTENTVVYAEGTSQVMQGVAREDIDIFASGYSSLLPFIESDDLRPILELSTGDEPQVGQNVETLATADVPEAQRIADVNTTGRAFTGPPGIPDDINEIIVNAYEEALNDEDFLADAENAGRPVKYGGPERAQAMADNSYQTWNELSDLLETLIGD